MHFTRIDLQYIHPKLVKLCEQLVENCKARGHEYYAISGYRDPKQQEALYAIGRTTELDRKPVTNAKPYSSYHNFGLAIDFAKDKDAARAGLQPDWDIKSYEILASEARKLGLVSGMDFKTFKEGPHIQVPFAVAPLNELTKILKEKDLSAVWAEVDKKWL
jgi:peptidoglycan LD-endopeptidase CwlK